MYRAGYNRDSLQEKEHGVSTHMRGGGGRRKVCSITLCVLISESTAILKSPLFLFPSPLPIFSPSHLFIPFPPRFLLLRIRLSVPFLSLLLSSALCVIVCPSPFLLISSLPSSSVFSFLLAHIILVKKA